MGRSKWRNRHNQHPVESRKDVLLEPAATLQSITPGCPGYERPGFDHEVSLALIQVDALIRDMRDAIRVPPLIVDADTALRRYLVYLSMLIDVILADLMMSAVHENDLAVRLKRRMLLEYVNKAIYCADHPDYCLYLTTVAESESVLKKLTDGNAPAADVEAETKHLEVMRDRFKPSYKRPMKFADIIRDHTRPSESRTNDEYVWLYGMPSALIHGDPEGMRALLPLNTEGYTAPTFAVTIEELNAMMVDVGSNILVFCDIFIHTFKSSVASLKKRSRDLDFILKTLSLKHPYGRPPEAMRLVKTEVAALLAQRQGDPTST